MRGSLSRQPFAYQSFGIIPAHAGLTRYRECPSSGTGDHPRACGAHSFPFPARCFHPGSSPRMRGSQQCQMSLLLRLGIIPAHAGLTPSYTHLLMPSGDHPRACGAHVVFHHIAHWIKGSSPRMRGSRSLYLRARRGSGIIPAHAGLTSAPTARACLTWDHPRACGAHSRENATSICREGSSPRMRGSQEKPALLRPLRGIIPAHAGLTC